MLTWISEADALPIVGEKVMLAHPDRLTEFWHVHIAVLLTRHENVQPAPVKPGDDRPADFWWGNSHDVARVVSLVNGSNWWAALDEIELPPGAVHEYIRGFHCIVNERLS